MSPSSSRRGRRSLKPETAGSSPPGDAKRSSNKGSSPARQAGDGGSTPPGRTIINRRRGSTAERFPGTEEIVRSITVGGLLRGAVRFPPSAPTPPPKDGTRRYERRR